VRLTWEKPGHLTLTLRDSDETGTHIHVPVTISGESKPPVIAFAPGYLADALEIGSTLRLIDELRPRHDIRSIRAILRDHAVSLHRRRDVGSWR